MLLKKMNRNNETENLKSFSAISSFPACHLSDLQHKMVLFVFFCSVVTHTKKLIKCHLANFFSDFATRSFGKVVGEDDMI